MKKFIFLIVLFLGLNTAISSQAGENVTMMPVFDIHIYEPSFWFFWKTGKKQKKRLSVCPAFFDLFIHTRYFLQALPIKNEKSK